MNRVAQLQKLRQLEALAWALASLCQVADLPKTNSLDLRLFQIQGRAEGVRNDLRTLADDLRKQTEVAA